MTKPPCRRNPGYDPWSAMRARCLNAAHHAYKDYGARGIKVCERWNDFNNFLADMGPRPCSRHTIERIDNNGNYEPGNCRWATMKEQNRNRRNTLMVKFRGSQMPLIEACELAGNDYNRVHHRISAGWDVLRAIETPALEQYNTRSMERS
jgi:hypothetical protein